MKKIVLKLAIADDNSKRKALKVVAGVKGVDSVAVDMKEKKITVIGDVDPVYLTAKLRKFEPTELLSVGPAKEEKKEGEKKEEKKAGEKKEEKKPQSDAKKENKPEVPTVVHVPSSYEYKPYEYSVVSEENPNACTIC